VLNKNGYVAFRISVFYLLSNLVRRVIGILQ
jgi:hypothetical protein